MCVLLIDLKDDPPAESGKGKFTEDVEHPLLCFGGGLDGWERGFPNPAG